MKVKRDVLEDHLQEYEREVVGLRSYIQELKGQTDKHGTERSEYETDLIEAEHNVKFYDAEIARIKQELRDGRFLPRAAKQGIGFFVSTAVGFIAGVFLGSQLKAGRKDSQEGGGEG